VDAPTARQRPVRSASTPEELDRPTVAGRVRLLTHLTATGAGRVYDLTDPVDRRRVYEVVLREG
jgi:hypothetical protein